MAALATLKHGWNAFLNQKPNEFQQGLGGYGISYGGRPDRVRLNISNERSIVSSIYTRLAIDFAAINIMHVRLDDEGRYKEQMDSGLSNCLQVEANLDQGPSAFKQDIALTLFEEGCIAVVPVETDVDPNEQGSYDIKTMRVGRIVQWYPQHVRVSLYNPATARREELVLEKRFVAIVENPLYAVMNEPNSTLQRLIRKLNLLDTIDEQSSSGKLDIIIQLPYVVKSESRKQQAEQRRKDIEYQLKGSKYGIAYTDGTEKITQLNRPAENNLLGQIEMLVKMLYGQLGLTEEVMNGTADADTMLNYYNRTIEPMVRAVAEEFHRKFLTKTARTQKQSMMFLNNPFKLLPIKDLAEIADKFTRNEILSSNEFRGIIGFKPHTDPKADQLVNSNLYTPDGTAIDPNADPNAAVVDPTEANDAVMNDAFDSLDAQLDELLAQADA